jgi:hypothetical protein
MNGNDAAWSKKGKGRYPRRCSEKFKVVDFLLFDILDDVVKLTSPPSLLNLNQTMAAAKSATSIMLIRMQKAVVAEEC